MTEPLKPWFPIATARLRLREFRDEDFDAVHAYASQPEVCRFMEWGPNTREQTVEFMDRKRAEQATWPRDDVNLAMEHMAGGQVIGSIRLSVIDRENLTGDLGYCLNSAYWRQGYASEASRAVLDIGFGILGLHRIWAECDVDNAGSWGVMSKLGMRREGCFRDGKLIKGAWRDRYVYAILAHEFNLPGQN